MRIHPQAIIFDYGKVLARPQSSADAESLAAIFRLPVAQFFEFYWRFRVPYDAAELEPAEYWTTVAQAAAHPLTSSQIDRLIEIDSLSWSHPAPVMPEWARDLREAGVRTALLSNMPVTVRQAVDVLGWLPDFDHRTFSCDVGICKPAPEIYLHSLSGLGLKPAEVLFLDDRLANVRGAEAVGMHALLFSSAGEAAAEIERRFVVPVPLLLPAQTGESSHQGGSR